MITRSSAATLLGVAIVALAVRADQAIDRSIYQLEASWTDDSGRPMKLAELQGNVQVVTFFYTSCESACPLTVKALQSAARAVSPANRARTRFVLISVDPDRDTLEELRRYRRTMHLDGQNWKLLRGSTTDVRRLAAVLGFNYEQIDSGQIVHSNLVTILNPRGEVVHQQNAVGSDRAALANAIQQAQTAEAQ